MNVLQTTKLALSRAGDWFLFSGIQEPSGGVARYYRSDLGKNARVSNEITGYAVSTLLYFAEKTGSAQYRDAGLRAAHFLTHLAWDRALRTFPFEYSDNCDQPKAHAYFFDCGIIVRGLLAAWRASGQQRFLDTAVAAGRSMIADFQAESALHPILTLPNKCALPYEPKWSACPGCYQLKSAMAWHDLFQESGEHGFRDAYESALHAALANDPVFLPGVDDQEKVMDRLHAYSYFLEGMLPCADRPACRSAIRNGIERTARYLNQIAPVFARSDVYAQLLRVRLYAAHLGVVALDETAAEHEASCAAGFQLESDDKRFDGGYLFGRKGSVALPFVNPVSTGFCAQALALWDDYKAGAFTARVHDLV